MQILSIRSILGLIACIAAPKQARLIALAVQAFALLGTLVGAFTIALGIGPQTAADHIFLLVILVAGLLIVFASARRRMRAESSGNSS